MINDRYYYSILPDDAKAEYKQLYEGITKLKRTIVINRVSAFPADTLWRYIELDNPFLFYVDFSTLKTLENDDKCIFCAKYLYSKYEIKQLSEKLKQILKRIFCRINGNTEFEKEKSIHDLLIANVSYDAGEFAQEGIHPQSHSIVGVLLNKLAVCSGVSKATKLLLNMVDIKCIITSGTDLAMDRPHAWNIVKLGNKAYNLDVTYDINLSDSNEMRYDYFNLPDNDIVKDHRFDVPHPACNDYTDGYYYRNGLHVNGLEEARNIVRHATLKHKRSITFRFSAYIGTAEEISNRMQNIINSISATDCKSLSAVISVNQGQQIVSLSFSYI